MTSDRLNHLQKRVVILRQHLLPDPFQLPGRYSDEELVKIQTLSFRVLVHAEIESYFEDRVIEIAKAALRSWNSHRHVCRPVVCLLAFSGHEMVRPPNTLKAPGDNQRKLWQEMLDIDHRLQRAASEFIRITLRENHGIRERNILGLLLPVGYDAQQIDDVFLADIEEFCKRRGEAAHMSTLVHVQQGIDPKDEHDRVQVLVANLEQFDRELDNLLSQTCVA